MKTVDEVIDEIILKSPYGAKAWEERQKRKCAAQNDIKKKKEDDDSVQDHPQQTYFNFEDHGND